MSKAFRDALIALLTFALVFPAVALAETWVGNSNNNTKNGTPQRDEYEGRGGADTLKGAAAHDAIQGEDGWDTLRGEGSGNYYDVLTGGDGQDDAQGGGGEDYVYGNNGYDTLNGDDGWDDGGIIGGPGNDTIRGGQGQDRLYAYEASGSDPDPVVDGGADYDTCSVNQNDSWSNCVPY